jgi:HK97 family phage major capsid protein
MTDTATEAKSAAELYAEAGAKFAEAKAFADEHASPTDPDALDSAESEQRFDALMAEGAELDKAYQARATKEGRTTDLRSRLQFYAQKATGRGLPFADESKRIIDPSNPTHPQAGNGLVVPGHAASIGQMFIGSDEYKSLFDSGALDSDKAGVESKRFVASPEAKAATDLIFSGAGGGGALVTPQFLPGVLPLPQRPLTVRDLFSQATTQTDTISYARQSAFDDAAAAVAQATAVTGTSGTKPQSSIAWTRQTAVIETLATWMAATRRQLADAGQTASLIDNQIRLMLQLEEEDQLMSGNGTSPNLRGIRNTVGIQTLDVSAASGNGDVVNLDALRTSIRLVRTGAARAQADAMVVNPLDSEEIDLTRDSQANYRGGGPFRQDATGNPLPVWGLRRVESEAIPSGKVLVGAYRQGATVFEREGISITTSSSHADFFVRNLVAVLGEERIGLAVFFPAAFVEVTLKTWP